MNLEPEKAAVVAAYEYVKIRVGVPRWWQSCSVKLDIVSCRYWADVLKR